MSEVIKVDKSKVRNISNRINNVSSDIKFEMTELLQVVSNVDFAWHGEDKEKYIALLNEKARILLSMSKLLDSLNDTLNYMVEKNDSLNSVDNIINLYKDGRK